MEATESAACDVVVIGGGIVGLAVARELALDRRQRVVVLEAEREIASHQSGRNSGVIHAGLYYRPGSEKARLCAAGRKKLYGYCEERSIPFRRWGKLVLATTPEEEQALDRLTDRGRANGLQGLEWLVPEQIREREPAARGRAGLWVPQTGVVDYRRVALGFAADLIASGGEVRTNARVRALQAAATEVVVESEAGAFRCAGAINCAGLQSDHIARLDGLAPEVRIVPIRGEYRRLAPPAADRVRGLIYPVPDPRYPFLGVHLTRTVDSVVMIGPNAVPAFSRTGYRRFDVSARDLTAIVGSRRSWRLAAKHWRTGAAELHRSLNRRAFLAQAQKLVPSIRNRDLLPAPGGIRAQAVDRSGEFVDDFRFARNGRVLHVLNAPSPAATSALAIAGVIAERIAAEATLP